MYTGVELPSGSTNMHPFNACIVAPADKPVLPELTISHKRPSLLPSFQLRPSGLPKPRAGSMAATTPLAQTRGTIQTNLSKTGPLRRVRKSRHGRIFQTALAGKWRVGSWRRWSPSPLFPTPLPNTLIVSSPPREVKACSALLFIKAPTGRTSTELLHLSTDASVGGEMR